jgi:hypothetical protein
MPRRSPLRGWTSKVARDPIVVAVPMRFAWCPTFTTTLSSRPKIAFDSRRRGVFHASIFVDEANLALASLHDCFATTALRNFRYARAFFCTYSQASMVGLLNSGETKERAIAIVLIKASRLLRHSPARPCMVRCRVAVVGSFQCRAGRLRIWWPTGAFGRPSPARSLRGTSSCHST